MMTENTKPRNQWLSSEALAEFKYSVDCWGGAMTNDDRVKALNYAQETLAKQMKAGKQTVIFKPR